MDDTKVLTNKISSMLGMFITVFVRYDFVTAHIYTHTYANTLKTSKFFFLE